MTYQQHGAYFMTRVDWPRRLNSRNAISAFYFPYLVVILLILVAMSLGMCVVVWSFLCGRRRIKAYEEVYR